VSLGDLLDRGPDSRLVLDLLMRLQSEALADGGHVHVVLGNHELMNLIGDWRYVTPDDYAAFAAEETEALRVTAYAGFAAAAGADTETTRELFERTYPRGYFARRSAFAADGRYGAWLLSLPAAVVINDTAYVHGGLPQTVAETSLETLNAELQTHVRRYLELRASLAAAGVLPIADMANDTETARAALATASPELAPQIQEFLAVSEAPELGIDGPLWYRGSVYCKPLLEWPILTAGLERLAVERVVVGHTPTGDRRARALYDGKLVMLDTGMLVAYYHGRPGALVLDGGDMYVQYVAPPERTALEEGAIAEPYALTEPKLVDALTHGALASFTRAESGAPWPVTLEYEDNTIEAAFYPRADGHAGDLELAAAALDDLLGTALVAPTVARTLDGEEGALQLRYPGAITEAQRVERQLGFSGWCPIPPQLNLMHTFDLLTMNRGRTAANVIYTNDFTDLTLTDHRNAFGPERTLPAGFDATKLDIPAPLVAALRAADEKALAAALGERLDARRIRALVARRDRLLAGR
jgi:hypothetical protein